MKIETLAEDVQLYAFQGAPDGFGLNVVAVLDGDRALLIDAAEPAQAARVRDDLAARGAQVTAVVLSHGHSDHVDGLAELPGVQVLAPAGLALDPSLAPSPRFVADGEVLRHGEHFIALDSAPGHAAVHQVATIDGRIACVGDLVIFTPDDRPCLPYLGEDGGDAAAHVASLRRLADLAGGPVETLLVPGHGPVLRGAAAIGRDLAARADYLERLDAAGAAAHLSDCLDDPEVFSRVGYHVVNRGRIRGGRAPR